MKRIYSFLKAKKNYRLEKILLIDITYLLTTKNEKFQFFNFFLLHIEIDSFISSGTFKKEGCKITLAWSERIKKGQWNELFSATKTCTI